MLRSSRRQEGLGWPGLRGQTEGVALRGGGGEAGGVALPQPGWHTGGREGAGHSRMCGRSTVTGETRGPQGGCPGLDPVVWGDGGRRVSGQRDPTTDLT